MGAIDEIWTLKNIVASPKNMTIAQSGNYKLIVQYGHHAIEKDFVDFAIGVSEKKQQPNA